MQPQRAAALLCAAIAAFALGAGAERRLGPSAGRQIYRKGRLVSGAPLRALIQGDIPVTGDQLSCVGCHQRSGLGTSEGGVVTPPLTEAALYSVREPGVREAYRSKSAGGQVRPAYSDTALARAIRRGVDPAGRILDRLMPRYELPDEDMAALIAYLKTLSREPSPGVDDRTIHLATVVARGVEARQRRAMLELLDAFVTVKNAEPRHESSRARRGPWYKEWEYQSYRRWELHVWELGEDRASWHDELARHYGRQPVFALVSGIARGSWRPIHEFCSDFEIPCVLPNTVLPVVDPENFYTIYLSKGLLLEAQALALHLEQTRVAGRPDRIFQVYRRGSEGEAAAKALSAALQSAGADAPQDRALEPNERLSADSWRASDEGKAPSTIVLWLSAEDTRGLDDSPTLSPRGERVFLSSTLLAELPKPAALAPALGDRVFLVHPFESPAGGPRKTLRLRAWMRARKLEPLDERIQANTFLAARLVSEATKHLRSHFSRDYFIEGLEHSVDTSVFASVYPRVTLGPGQRFASKGCFVLGRKEGSEVEWSAVSPWLVP